MLSCWSMCALGVSGRPARLRARVAARSVSCPQRGDGCVGSAAARVRRQGAPGAGGEDIQDRLVTQPRRETTPRGIERRPFHPGPQEGLLHQTSGHWKNPAGDSNTRNSWRMAHEGVNVYRPLGASTSAVLLNPILLASFLQKNSSLAARLLCTEEKRGDREHYYVKP